MGKEINSDLVFDFALVASLSEAAREGAKIFDRPPFIFYPIRGGFRSLNFDLTSADLSDCGMLTADWILSMTADVEGDCIYRAI